MSFLIRLLTSVGEITLLSWDSFRLVWRRPFGLGLIVEQMFKLGVRSLPLVAITTVFTGAVMALQVSFTLSAYGAAMYVGSFVGVSMIKELGPVLTGVMIAARVGAGITAELGSMKVTEQIDALRALGASPTKQLVIPRLGALLLMLPVLTVLGDTLGILGGLYIGVFELDQTTDYYWAKVKEFLFLSDLVSGTAKTVFFAFFIGIIACYNGLKTRGGATGVGQATTNTVVAASLAIFISNFFLAKLFLMIQAVIEGLT
jgi:phospholipid/cholesterol/gamma-HCH transport system permease protein